MKGAGKILNAPHPTNFCPKIGQFLECKGDIMKKKDWIRFIFICHKTGLIDNAENSKEKDVLSFAQCNGGEAKISLGQDN